MKKQDIFIAWVAVALSFAGILSAAQPAIAEVLKRPTINDQQGDPLCHTLGDIRQLNENYDTCKRDRKAGNAMDLSFVSAEIENSYGYVAGLKMKSQYDNEPLYRHTTDAATHAGDE